jgi:hypothetical protein
MPLQYHIDIKELVTAHISFVTSNKIMEALEMCYAFFEL